GLGFFVHPSLVIDAVDGVPYGYCDVKIWNRPLEFRSKHQRQYNNLPIEEKESYKWIEASRNTQSALSDVVEGMVIVIVQVREGDMYEQFAVIPNQQTDLLIRARTDRRLADGTKLFDCLSRQPPQGAYEVPVTAIEEVFKVLKKEGYNIEASELEYARSIRKLCLMIMETVIKLFLMRLAYARPETELNADSCFSPEEQAFLEHQITALEGKTDKQKNPYKERDLKRYTWAIARLGGWKGYESKRHPGITTLWIGLKHFKAAFEGWQLHKDVSTR